MALPTAALVLAVGGILWLVGALSDRRVRRESAALAAELQETRALQDLPADGSVLRHRLAVDPAGQVRVTPLGPIEVPESWIALKGASEVVARALRQQSLIGDMRPPDAEIRVVLWRPSRSGGGSWVVIGTCGEDGAAGWRRANATTPPPAIPAGVTRGRVQGGICPMDRLLLDYPERPEDGVVYEAALVGYWISTSASPAVFAAAGVAVPSDGDRAMIDRLLGAPVTGEEPPSEAVEAQRGSSWSSVGLPRPIERAFRAVPQPYAIAAMAALGLLAMANAAFGGVRWVDQLVSVAFVAVVARLGWEGHASLRLLGAPPILGHVMVLMVMVCGITLIGLSWVPYPLPLRNLDLLVALAAFAFVAISLIRPDILVDLAERPSRRR